MSLYMYRPAGQTVPAPVPRTVPAPLATPAPDPLQLALTALSNDVRSWRLLSVGLASLSVYLGYRSWRSSRVTRRTVAELARRRETLASIRRLAE